MQETMPRGVSQVPNEVETLDSSRAMVSYQEQHGSESSCSCRVAVAMQVGIEMTHGGCFLYRVCTVTTICHHNWLPTL
eukprot:5748515-Amphidinium_carterae.1